MNNTNEKSHLMYSTLPNIIIGFHGCDQEVFNKILYEHKPFKPSTNEYDWLGNGMYFWEQNLERAWEWATCGMTNPKLKIEKPAVIGAVIDLGYCCCNMNFSLLKCLFLINLLRKIKMLKVTMIYYYDIWIVLL